MTDGEHPLQPRDLLRELPERLAEFERRAAERHFRDVLFDLLFAYALHEFDRAAVARDYYFECHAFRWPSPWERSPHDAAERLAEALDVEPDEEVRRLARLSFPQRAADAAVPARALLEACERLRPGRETRAFYRLLLDTIEGCGEVRAEWSRLMGRAVDRDTLAGSLYVRSLLDGARGRWNAAADALSEALRLRPDAWPLHLERAWLSLAMEKPAEAARSVAALETVDEQTLFAGAGLRDCLAATRERWGGVLHGPSGRFFLSQSPRALRDVLEGGVCP